MLDYNKRLVEVDEILSYLPEDELCKIPEDIKQIIKENRDPDYIWNYDDTKTLKDQGVSRDTIIILSYLNMEYLLNEEQKKLMQQIHEFNDKKMQKKQLVAYDTSSLFKNKEKNIESVKDTPKINNELVVYKKNIFSKILEKLKKFLGIK